MRPPLAPRVAPRVLRPLWIGLLGVWLSGCGSLPVEAARSEAAEPALQGLETQADAPASLDTAAAPLPPGETPAEAVLERVESSAPFPEVEAETLIVNPWDDDDEIWQRVRAGYALPDHSEQTRVQSHIDWFRCNLDYLERVTARAEPFLHMILGEIEDRGMPSELLLLPVVESAYVPYAYSHGRASGIWQFIPATGRRFGLKQNWWYDGRRDVWASTIAALDYLEHLHKYFDDDWLLALAAYNAGEGNVRRAVRRNEKAGKPTDFWNLRLPRETSHYVPKLLAVSQIVADPEFYGLQLWPVPDQPYLARIEVDSQIDLALAAELADIELEQFYLLNPGYNRWATDPEGPHRLLLPLAHVRPFEEGLAQVPPEQRVTWARHRIRSGETLGHIAERYGVTVSTLKRSNQLRSSRIRAGDYLLVPSAQRPLTEYTQTSDQRRLAQQSKERGGVKRIHVVQRGDTLWEIARDYGVGVRELASWNAMAPGDTLHPGKQLVIWVRAATAPAGSAALRLPQFEHPLAEQTVRRVRYSVRNGDSLYLIARRFQVEVNDIARWNSLDTADVLRPGRRLTLYVDVLHSGG